MKEQLLAEVEDVLRNAPTLDEFGAESGGRFRDRCERALAAMAQNGRRAIVQAVHRSPR